MSLRDGNPTTQFGNVALVRLAEQRNRFGDRSATNTSARVVSNAGAVSGGDFLAKQPRPISTNIRRTGTTIRIPTLDESSAETKDAAGSYTIEDGFTIALSMADTEAIFAMLTQTLNPIWKIYGGSGQNLPAAVTVINAQLLKNASTALTVADNLSSTTSPVRITFTPTSTAQIASGQKASIVITGTDFKDRPIDERLTWTSDAPTAAQTTKLWYKTVTTPVTSQGWTEGSGRSVTATARDTSVQVNYRPYDLVINRFWTALVVKGIVPNVYWDLVLNECVIEIGQEEAMSLACSFLGSEAALYTNIAKQSGPTARADTFTDITKAVKDVYAGPQVRLFADGVGGTDIRMKMSDTTFTVNQNLTYADIYGDRFQNQSPGRETKRLVQLEGQGIYAPENNMSTYFENNNTLTNVELRMEEDGLGAYPYSTIWRIPEFQFTADPDPEVAEGIIYQDLIGKAILPDNQTWEYEIECRYPSYNQVLIFS